MLVEIITSIYIPLSEVYVSLTVTDRIQILMIFVTLIVAFIGPYFGEILKYNFRKPKIEIVYKQQNPFRHKTKAILPNGGMYNVYYFRLKVRNKGRLSAEECKVFLEEVAKKDDFGNFNKDENFTPIALTWSATAGNENNELSIHRENSFFIDLGYINSPQNIPSSVFIGYSPEEQLLNKFVFASNYRQFSQLDSLVPGNYLLKLTIYSKNAEKKSIKIFLSWTGTWHEDESEMFKQIILEQRS